MHERGTANGWIFAGVGAGAGLSPPLISYIIVRFDWRWSFWACALLGLIAGSVWFVIARNDPGEHPRVSDSELSLIRSGLTPAMRERKPRVTQLLPWGAVLRSKEVMAVTLSYFCFGYVAWIFFSWFYIYLEEVRGLNLKASAFYAMLPFLAMAVCCPVGGVISDRLTRWYGPRMGRCWVAAMAVASTAMFLAFGSQVESPRLASVVLAGGAGTLYLSQSSFWSVTADIAGASSGSVSGFMNMGAQIGGAVTASLTPWIATRFGWTTSFMTAAALCLVGAAAWLIVDPSQSLRQPTITSSRELDSPQHLTTTSRVPSRP
jgi:ACS family glucarate transporter-like MFS transporter